MYTYIRMLRVSRPRARAVAALSAVGAASLRLACCVKTRFLEGYTDRDHVRERERERERQRVHASRQIRIPICMYPGRVAVDSAALGAAEREVP